jgi:hypothetical protein
MSFPELLAGTVQYRTPEIGNEQAAENGDFALRDQSDRGDSPVEFR